MPAVAEQPREREPARHSRTVVARFRVFTVSLTDEEAAPGRRPLAWVRGWPGAEVQGLPSRTPAWAAARSLGCGLGSGRLCSPHRPVGQVVCLKGRWPAPWCCGSHGAKTRPWVPGGTVEAVGGVC